MGRNLLGKMKHLIRACKGGRNNFTVQEFTHKVGSRLREAIDTIGTGQIASRIWCPFLASHLYKSMDKMLREKQPRWEREGKMYEESLDIFYLRREICKETQ